MKYNLNPKAQLHVCGRSERGLKVEKKRKVGLEFQQEIYLYNTDSKESFLKKNSWLEIETQTKSKLLFSLSVKLNYCLPRIRRRNKLMKRKYLKSQY